MFGKVIGLIGLTRLTVENELKQFGTITNPVETFAHCLGAVLFDSAV
jgi:hypothetical protein